jgi:hypothetical protein
MGRGRSPARGRSHPIQPKEIDALATEAVAQALTAWNARLRYNQVTADVSAAKLLANGNLEIILRLDTSTCDFDMLEFADFMENQVCAPCTVRYEGGNHILVAENETILQAVPKYRFHWRVQAVRWLEALYAVIFKIGLFGLIILLVFGLPAIFPGFYKVVGTYLWDFVKGFFAAIATAVSPQVCE